MFDQTPATWKKETQFFLSKIGLQKIDTFVTQTYLLKYLDASHNNLILTEEIWGSTCLTSSTLISHTILQIYRDGSLEN